MTTKLEGIQEHLIAKAQAEYEVQLRDALNNFWKAADEGEQLYADRDALKARVAELEQWREGAINFYPKLEAMEMASTDLNKARSEGCDD